MGNHHKTLGLRSLRFPGKEPAHNAKKISPAKNLPSSSTQPKSLTQFHEASGNLTKPHAISRSLTQFHEASRNFTKPHAISRSLTQFHEASRHFTKPHQANNSQSSERLAAC